MVRQRQRSQAMISNQPGQDYKSTRSASPPYLTTLRDRVCLSVDMVFTDLNSSPKLLDQLVLIQNDFKGKKSQHFHLENTGRLNRSPILQQLCPFANGQPLPMDRPALASGWASQDTQTITLRMENKITHGQRWLGADC